MAQTEGNMRRADKIAELQSRYEPNCAITNSESAECYVTDLLADIRHYCDQHGVKFARADKAAYQHYSEEAQEND